MTATATATVADVHCLQLLQAGEQPVFSADGNGSDGVFYGVVVDGA